MDSRRFRNALGQFPTGVVVATARTAAGQLIGMTMSSFNSVSLDPPLILFSVLRQAHSFAVWQGIDRYAINVLNEEQEQVSNQFARSKGDKWEGISPLTGDTGVPMLPNAAVVFECETHARFDGGDHEIFVAQVAAMHEHSVNRGRPLVFFEGRYRQLASSANAHAAARSRASPRLVISQAIQYRQSKNIGRIQIYGRQQGTQGIPRRRHVHRLGNASRLSSRYPAEDPVRGA